VKHLYRESGSSEDWPARWCVSDAYDAMVYDPDRDLGSFTPAESNCPACFAAVRAFALTCEAAEHNAAAAEPPAFVGTVEELADWIGVAASDDDADARRSALTAQFTADEIAVARALHVAFDRAGEPEPPHDFDVTLAEEYGAKWLAMGRAAVAMGAVPK